jgi:hypothetical protein
MTCYTVIKPEDVIPPVIKPVDEIVPVLVGKLKKKKIKLKKN